MAAKSLGLSSGDAFAQKEHETGFVENLLKSFYLGAPEAAYVPPSRRPVYDRDLFEAVIQCVHSRAEDFPDRSFAKIPRVVE